MVELDGLGHARILADARVIARAVDFVTPAG
jgi:ATP phosphoribosyltransferase regulatory subunit HisZ